MRLRFSLALVAGVLLSACANPLASSPPPTPAPTAEAAQPTANVAAPTTAADQPTAQPTQPTAAADQPTSQPAQPTAAATSGPKYEQADCKFETPSSVEVVCGYLTVPEDRSAPTGKQIRLHVAVFKSTSPNPATDPVVYLEGGPGGHALDGVQYSFQSHFAPFLADRDFIIFDQRGTGYSEPSLDCPEVIDIYYQTLDQNLSAEESTKLLTDATLKCHDRLAGEGINLAAYNDKQNAADVNDLRVALGYDKWNLYGISYGTQLALTTMRDFPDGIRSVILDSTVPLQAKIDADIPALADRVFNTLFNNCAADQACNQAFPNLKTTFYDLVDRLDKQPVTETATDPLSGKDYQVLLNGDTLLSTLYQTFYQTDVIPQLPKAIVAAGKGDDYSFWAQQVMLSVVNQKFVSPGMFYSVKCTEEIPFVSRDEVTAIDQKYPEQQGVFDQSSYFDICPKWGAKPADPSENDPVKSDIPTLVLAGEFDPITPPAYGEEAAKTLSNSFFFGPFAGIGHGVSISGECPLNIAMTFLNTPTAKPDGSCMNEMKAVAFEVPGAAVKLKPYTSDIFGIKGVAPEDWKESSPGVFERSSSTVLLQQVLPGSQSAILQLLTTQFKLDKTPESAGTRKTDSLNWTLYSFKVQGQPADMALAEQAGKTYLVLLATDPIDHSSLYDQVFLPVIDAYTITS
jgi:pimeloyl-ACP methyl ester carboxylesterase